MASKDSDRTGDSDVADTVLDGDSKSQPKKRPTTKRDSSKGKNRTARAVAVPAERAIVSDKKAKVGDDDVKSTSVTTDEPVLPKLIVGLGASAGGLQPLEDFFRTVNPLAGHAYVVVQHLSPDFKSLMNELLGRQTSMAVQIAENGTTVQANSVYLIPPRTNLTINDNILHLEEQDVSSGTGPQFPIDVFLRSLASSAKARAIGVILSGTGSDGSRGVRAIDEAGGMVYVQDPATAQFDGMPNAARATVNTLQLLSPADIATTISELDTEVDGFKQLAAEQNEPDDELEKIIALVSAESDNDFSAYKQKTLVRRIARRRVITGADSLNSYRQLLKESTQERQILCGDLLISVTNFFRDEPAWQFLREEALPKVIASLPPDQSLRIWVTACSTGEEAYTMAMVAREAMDKVGRTDGEIKIFATDVDPAVLERAAAGVYPESIVADVPKDMLIKYFVVDGENYVVSRHLREMIIFAPHNILADAPFARMHVVSCRNALIYFKPEAQNRIISMLHFSLVLNGILFLGSSESVSTLESEFSELNRQWCLFSKLRDVRVPIESNFRTRLVEPKSTSAARLRGPSRDSLTELMIRDALQAITLERSWVCLICDGQSNVLHVLGDSQSFLQVPQGGMTSEVTRLVPDSLTIPLRSAIHRSQRERQTVNHSGISCDGFENLVDIQVIHRPTTRSTPEMFVITLMHSESVARTGLNATDITDIESAQQLNELELELRQTRENLQATIEELETTNEEQQATNEELIAANEELQSTNEELHSVNEELYTVNSEYQLKINELTEVTNDVDNLLESTDIGVVYLDSELKIRKFTPAATRDVHLLPGDIGRAFADLTYSFDYPELTADLRQVLSLGEAIEREVKSDKTEYILVRIHPYRAGSELTVGIVMTFINISELKRVEDALAQVETRYRHLFQSEMFGITLGNLKDRKIIDANDAFLNLLELNRNSLPILQENYISESELEELERSMRDLELSGANAPAPALLKKSNGDLVSVVIGRTLISAAEGTYVSFVIAAENLTEKAGVRLQEKALELETVRSNLQQFAYIASHQLQEPLRAVSGFAQLLKEKHSHHLDDESKGYVRHVQEGATRMSGVVEDLLLFSRVHTHAGPMDWVDTSLLVSGAIKQLQEEIDETSSIINSDKELPMIFVEGAQIQQVFAALIQNAIKYRGNKAATVDIRAKRSDEFWQFTVSDTGVGIKPENHERAFLMFQQFSPETATSARGIGLAICKRIVERHHGKIWIADDSSLGATVHFTLPYRPAPEI